MNQLPCRISGVQLDGYGGILPTFICGAANICLLCGCDEENCYCEADPDARRCGNCDCQQGCEGVSWQIGGDA